MNKKSFKKYLLLKIVAKNINLLDNKLSIKKNLENIILKHNAIILYNY